MRQKVLLLSLCLAFVSQWAMGQTTYYSKSTATDFNNVSSWGTGTDGTGTAPTSISNADNFVIGNGANMTLSAAASVRALYIGGGFTGFVPATATGTLALASGNSLTVARATGYNATLGVGTTGTLAMTGGAVILNGNFTMTAGNFNQSGGSITIDGNDGNTAASSVASGTPIFGISGGTPNCTSGTITIVDPCVNTYPAGGGTNRTIVIGLSASISYFTGTHTFIAGDGVSTTPGNTDGFVVETYSNSYSPIQNLTVNGGSATGRWASASNNNSASFGCHIKGNLTINAGSEMRQSYSAGQFQIGGNIVNNGTLTIVGSATGSALVIGTGNAFTVTAAQTISGGGVFRNATSSPTANFTFLTINNSAGVNFSATTALSGTGTGSVSGTLTLTAGAVNISSNTFTLGTGTGVLGTLAGSAGGFASGSTFARWYAATTAGTTIAASTIPTFSGSGTFPFVVGTNVRNFYLQRPGTTGATGGTLSVTFNEGAGGLTTLATPVIDGSYSINRQSNANWTVAASGGFAAGTGTFNYALSDAGAYVPANINSRLMKATSVPGTHQAGTLLPHVQRTAISASDYAGTFYAGINNADIAVPCTNPTGQPTSQVVSTVTNTSISGTFTAASGNPTNYLVVLATGSSTPTAPVDGTNYTVGASTLGTNTTIVSNGTAATFSASSLSANTAYTFYVYSFNTATCIGGPKYNGTLPLTFTVNTCPAAPTGISASVVTTTGFMLNWTAASAGGGAVSSFTYTVDVSTNSTFTAPVTGSPFNVTSGTSQTISGLSATTTYYYRVGTIGACTTYSSSASVTTACNNTTLPVAQGFNTSGTNVNPACWTQQNVSGSLPIQYVTTTAGTSPSVSTPYEGTRMVFYNSYTYSTSTRLVSPPITTTGTSSVDVNFQWYFSTPGGTGSYLTEGVTVQWSTDGTTWNDFSNNFIRRYGPTAGWSPIAMTLPSGAGNIPTLYVGFLLTGNGGYDIYMDTAVIKQTPSCFPPTSPSVTALTATTATFSWTAPVAGAASYDIYYGPAPLTPPTSSTTPTTTSSTTSVNVAGLTANTNYQFYVRSNCGGSNGVSTWSPVVSFTTACNNFILPIAQGFNTSGTNVNPACWTQQNVSGSLPIQYVTTTAGTSPSVSTPYEGTRMVFYNSYSNSTSTRLVSPPITTTGQPGIDVNFQWYFSTPGGTGFYLTEGVTVQWSTDGTTWNDFPNNFIRRYGPIAGWSPIAMTLPSGTANQPKVYVGFLLTGNSGYDIYMDTANITVTPACTTPAPGNTIATNSNVCLSTSTTLSAQNITPGAIVTYQWDSSINGTTYTAIAGATSATYTAYPSTSTYYRLNVTCSVGSTTATTTPIQITVNNCYFDVARSTGVSYNSVSSTGNSFANWNSATNTDDNTSGSTPIGFSFPYKGKSYTQFKVCTNGWLTLDTSTTQTTLGNGFTATTKLFLAPLWEDLVCPGNPATAAGLASSLKYQTTGTSPNQVCTVEWIGFEKFGYAGPNLNFQVKMYENGAIEYVYGTMEGFNGTSTSLYSITVGLSSIAGTGTTMADMMSQQLENTNWFAPLSFNNETSVQECFSMLSFTPMTLYTGPTSVVANPPVNDDVPGAIALSVNPVPCTSYCGTYYTSKAATASIQASPCTTAPDDDVWFSFQAPPSGQAKITILGSEGYDPVLGIYQTSLNAFTNGATNYGCVNANGTGSTEQVTLTTLIPNIQYFIRVSHNGTGSGTSNGMFSICVSDNVPPPANDDICGSISLNVDTACNTITGSTISATASTGSVTGCNTPDDDIWYLFIPTANNNQITLQSGAGFNAAMQIDTVAGNLCSATQYQVACVNNTSTAGVETYQGPWQVGKPYYIRVYHATVGAGTGNFTICVRSLPPTCPTVTAPAASASITSSNTTITWTAVTNAVGYDVYVSTNQNDVVNQLPAALVSTSQAALSYTVTPLSTSTIYYYKILSVNNFGQRSTGCSARDFNTNPPACLSAPTSPGNAASICSSSTPTTLSWLGSAGATGYNVYFNAGTSPATTLVSANQSGTSYTTAAALAAGSYSWRVVPINSNGSPTGCPDWTFTVLQSPIVSVTPSTASFCSGSSATPVALTASGNATGYVWTPTTGLYTNAAGTTAYTGGNAATVYAKPSITTNYIVTGSSSIGCNTTATAVVSVNGAPRVFITPAASTKTCGGTAVQLDAMVAGSTVAQLFSEDFNNGYGSFTPSTGPAHTQGAFLIYPSGYTYTNLSLTFNTSDASNFVMVNSDSNGSGQKQRLYLTSSPFATTGYDSIKVGIENFYQKWTSGDSAIQMQASTDATTWTTVYNLLPNGTHGSASTFAKDTIVLPKAFSNQSNVYLRMIYASTFGYYWAINNIGVSGQALASASTTWSMATDLYTNAAATIPYVSGSSVSTVYSTSSSDIKYVAVYDNGTCTDTSFATVSVSGSSSALAGAAGTTVIDTASVVGSSLVVRSAACNLIATITPGGAQVLAGSLSASVTQDNSVQSYLSLPYATRHYDIVPQQNASAATAAVKLYFTQAEMNAVNSYIASNNLANTITPMPTGPSDAQGIANLRIKQYHGTGTAPGNYTGTTATITPSNVTWNSTNSWWEVTFPVSGFSGFYLTTGRFPTIALKAYLQGALSTGTTMDNYLQNYYQDGTDTLLPKTNPYGVSGIYYTQVNKTNGPAGAVVDWVKVEVRDSANPSNILQTRALLLKPNGNIVDTLGNAPYFNMQASKVMMAVWHRNHLAILSNPITAPTQDEAKSYDFTTALSKASNPYFGDPQQMVQKNGVWCMWSGDVNNTQDLYIDNSDLFSTKAIFLQNLYDVYNLNDVNMDGYVDNADLFLVKQNFLQNLYSTISNY